MTAPIVGKRYRFKAAACVRIVGECREAKGEFWWFRLEGMVKGLSRDWRIGDLMAVRASYVEDIEEIPLDAQG